MVSSFFSSQGQLQSAPPICKPPPPVYDPPWIPTTVPILVQANWHGNDRWLGPFSAAHKITAEWFADENYWAGDTGPLFPHTTVIIYKDQPAGEVKIAFSYLWTDVNFHLQTFYRAKPQDDEAWTPTVEYHDHSEWAYSFDSEILLLRA